MNQLTQKLNKMDADLDQEVADDIESSINEVDEDIAVTNKELKEGLRQKVEKVKRGIKDRKDALRQKVKAAEKGIRDQPYKEAEDALNAMEKDLSQGDLVSAHINRWIANVWLKAAR